MNFTSAFLLSSQLAVVDIQTSGSFTEADNIFYKYMMQIGSTKYNAIIGITNFIILFIIFAIRYKVYYESAGIDKSNIDLCKRYKHYVFNHISICFIFAFIICFLGIIIVNSNINIVWNFIVAPLLGFLLSIIFENEVLTKFEEKYSSLSNPLHEKHDSDKKEDKKENLISNDTNNINININNGTDVDSTNSTDDKFVLKSDETLSDQEKVEVTINRLIDSQKSQSEILEKHTLELENQSQTLDNLQALMKNMIRFEIEDMIYECLNKGYATPAEDKKIRVKYKDYRANKGNGDIEELYEKRYIKLKIHDD
jgi:hypothetical protein